MGKSMCKICEANRRAYYAKENTAMSIDWAWVLLP